MILETKTIQEFNNACKEYYKYHYSRYTVSETEQGSAHIIEGISFMITEPWQFKDEETRKLFTTNVCILDDSLPLLGKLCKPTQTMGQESNGKFIGIEATEEDFYYVLESPTGSRYYESCVGSIEAI